MNIFRKRSEGGINSLREALHLSSASESLDDLPERFARIISQYENLNVHPQFRQDVFNVLNGGADIALAMVDETFPVEQASAVISAQLAILSRVLLHLQSRPALNGWSIMHPGPAPQLFGHFSTRVEAEQQLSRYCSVGVSQNCVVVPTKVLSLHAIQPAMQRLEVPKSLEPKSPEPELAPIPTGIIPNTRAVNPGVELLHAPEEDLSLRTTNDPPLPPLEVPPVNIDDLRSRLDKIDEDSHNLTKSAS